MIISMCLLAITVYCLVICVIIYVACLLTEFLIFLLTSYSLNTESFSLMFLYQVSIFPSLRFIFFFSLVALEFKGLIS